jgi:hypothetical protein
MNPQPPPYFAPPQAPPKKKRKWPWIVGGIFALLVISSVANRGSDTTSGNTPAATTTATPVAAGTQAPAATQPPAPEPAKPAGFGSGTHRVPQDVKPGTYKTEGPDGLMCYWARLKNTTGSFDAIITNGSGDGPTTVTIVEGDGAFETRGCKPWVAVS